MIYILITLFVFFNPCTLMATDYYISVDGAESWPSCTSIGNPCAAGTGVGSSFLAAVAGDTVYFLDGTYDIIRPIGRDYKLPTWSPSNSGTVGSPITFKAVNKYGAILDGSNEDATAIGTSMIGAAYQNYVVWDGFKIEAHSGATSIIPNVQFRGPGVTGGGLYNSWIVGATHNTGGSNNIQGFWTDQSTGVTLHNSLLEGFVETSEDNHNTSAVKTYDITDFTVSNCEILDNTAGIYLKGSGSVGAVIKNNYVHDNTTNFLYSILDTSQSGTIVTNNIFSSPGTANVSITSNDEPLLNTENHVVYNNTFYNGNGYIWDVTSSGNGISFYNNIVVRDNTDLASGQLAGDPKYIDYNIYSTLFKATLREYAVDYATYTTLADWQLSGELDGGGNPDVNSYVTDPLFVNVSGSMNTIADFALDTGSPAIGRGRYGGDIGADVSLVGIGASASVGHRSMGTRQGTGSFR